MSDAMGSASEIPSLLSKVAWAGEDVARDSLDQLADRVCALGFVVSEVTSVVVPFLVELAAKPDCKCRVEIVELISSIYLARQWEDSAKCVALKYRSSFEVKVAWEASSRDEILASKGVFESLVQGSDFGVAIAASHLLEIMNSS
jgi:hypothetical protein